MKYEYVEFVETVVNGTRIENKYSVLNKRKMFLCYVEKEGIETPEWHFISKVQLREITHFMEALDDGSK